MPDMLPQNFTIPVVIEQAWPDQPKSYRVTASLSRDGNEVAHLVPGFVKVNPPRAGRGRVNFPDAPPMFRCTEIVHEPFRGEWRAMFTLKASDETVNLCGAELLMTLPDCKSGTVFVSKTHVSQGVATLTCEGMGVPPAFE